jgi:Tfp pilus assembly pilus retraction ATPase PilT
MVRKDGKMQKMEKRTGVLSPVDMKELLTSIMPAKNQEEFARRSDTDFAYEIPIWRVFARIFLWTAKEWAPFSASFRQK